MTLQMLVRARIAIALLCAILAAVAAVMTIRGVWPSNAGVAMALLAAAAGIFAAPWSRDARGLPPAHHTSAPT